MESRIKSLIFKWLDDQYEPVTVIEDFYHGIDKKLVFDKDMRKIVVVILNKGGELYKMSLYDDYILTSLIELFQHTEFETKKVILEWVMNKLKNE